MDSILANIQTLLSSWWVPGVVLLLLLLITILVMVLLFKTAYFKAWAENVSPRWLNNISDEFPSVYRLMEDLGNHKVTLAQFKDRIAGTAPIQEKFPYYFRLLNDLASGKISDTEFEDKIDPAGAKLKALADPIKSDYPYMVPLLEELSSRKIGIEGFKDELIKRSGDAMRGPRS